VPDEGSHLEYLAHRYVLNILGYPLLETAQSALNQSYKKMIVTKQKQKVFYACLHNKIFFNLNAIFGKKNQRKKERIQNILSKFF
jgi:NAD/NADP transhydrogenase beta subunit